MTSPSPSDPAPRFQRLRQLFEAAKERPPAEREAFVRRLAGADTSLAGEVIAMLRAEAADKTADLHAAGQAGMAQAANAIDPEDAPRDDGVQSTATADLLHNLATAPKLDTNRYQLEGEIDRGGIGAILRIHDRHLNRRLAMKVLLERRAPADDDEQKLAHQILGRFLEEAQVTSQLDHPGVVPVHELGLDQTGKVYFTMRLVKGNTAGEIIRLARAEEDGWTTTRVLEVVLKICDTMAFAHDKGVLHRDLKPQNVMVGKFGEVYVMDWGLAKVLGQPDKHVVQTEALQESRIDTARKRDAEEDGEGTMVTRDDHTLGTPSYMPPEQARGQVLDARADVYAIGTILYQMLTGSAPYVVSGLRQTAADIVRQVLAGPPKRIEDLAKDAPVELVAITEKAMQRDREQRYASAVELSTDLRAFLDQRSVKAYRTGALVELKLWVRRNKPLAASLAAAVLILVAGVVLSTTLANQKAAKARDFDQLASVVLHERVIAKEKNLYPAWPHKVAAMEAWLSDEVTPLLAMRADLIRTLAELRATALPYTDSDRLFDRTSHPRCAELEQLDQQIRVRSKSLELDTWQFRVDLDDIGRDERWMTVPTTSSWRTLKSGSSWEDQGVADFDGAAWYRCLMAPPSDASRWSVLIEGADDYCEVWCNGTLLGSMGDLAAQVSAYDTPASFDLPQPTSTVPVFDIAVRVVDWGGGGGLTRHVWLCASDRIFAISSMDLMSADQEQLQRNRKELDGILSRRRTWKFAGAATTFLHSTLKDILEKLNRLEENERAGVESRLHWAKNICEWSLHHPHARYEWDDVRSDLAVACAASPSPGAPYAGASIDLREEDIVGLVPIGRNPVSRLWEFYDLRSAWDGHCDPPELVIPTHDASGTIAVGEGTGIVLVLLPGGTCCLGSQASESGRPNFDPSAQSNEIIHTVSLAPFFMAKYEITQGQWARLWTFNEADRFPSFGAPGLVSMANPVENVTWTMCDRMLPSHGLQLPTEAQWEYACRAGTTTPWSFGFDMSAVSINANISDNDSFPQHAPVGSFLSNAFGLCDMHGNVCEWCRDWLQAYGEELAGEGLSSLVRISFRSARGGSFQSPAELARSASRHGYDPEFRSQYLGVRCIRKLHLE